MHNLFLGEFKRHCVEIWRLKSRQKQGASHNEEQQKEWLSRVEKAIIDKNSSDIKKARKGYIVAFCLKNGLPIPDNATKADLVTALLTWRTLNPTVAIQAPSAHKFPVLDFAHPVAPDAHVMTKEIVKEVWADMEITTLPSWVGRAPKEFGKTGEGKVKADQWRTACTIHLVITLIRLWGQSTSSDRDRGLLDNFMALVIAVQMATRRSTSEARRDIVQNHFRYYLETLVHIYGKNVLVPNHHLSLHLVECLHLFGPVHGWWSFPFERYNGVLQRIKSNYKLGELELTFFYSFCRMANLKGLLYNLYLSPFPENQSNLFDPAIPSELRERLQETLRSLDLEAVHSATPISMVGEASGPTELPNPIYDQLVDCINQDQMVPKYCGWKNMALPYARRISPEVNRGTKLEIDGVEYTTEHHSPADSTILYRSNGKRCAGRIQAIFAHTRVDENGFDLVEHFLCIKMYRPLRPEEKHVDPYQKYALLKAELYHNDFLATTCVINAAQVVSHVACCPYS
ncbi:hypothetical protein BV25DRAFT_1777682, partial [Artomyces pyxidatus]